MVSFVIVSVSMVFTVRVVRSTVVVVVVGAGGGSVPMDGSGVVVVVVVVSWCVRVGRTSLAMLLVAESVYVVSVDVNVPTSVVVAVSRLEAAAEVSVDATAVVEAELPVSVELDVAVVSTEVVSVAAAAIFRKVRVGSASLVTSEIKTPAELCMSEKQFRGVFFILYSAAHNWGMYDITYPRSSPVGSAAVKMANPSFRATRPPAVYMHILESEYMSNSGQRTADNRPSLASPEISTTAGIELAWYASSGICTHNSVNTKHDQTEVYR